MTQEKTLGPCQGLANAPQGRRERQFIRFALTGALGFVIDAGVLYFCLQAGLGYFSGRAISFLCAVYTTWLLNRRYTFQPQRETPLVTEALRYLSAMSVGGLLNYMVYSIVILSFPNLIFLPLIAVAIGSITGMLFNYFSAKNWVFKSS